MEKATGRSIAFSSFKITAYFNIGVHRRCMCLRVHKPAVSGCTNRQDSLLHMFFKKSLQTSTLFVLSANGIGGEGRGPIIGTPRGGGGGGGM